MMFGSAVMLATGNEVQVFTVYRSPSEKTTGGRVCQGKREWMGEIKAVLSQSRATEKERWKQLSHPVSHVLVVRGTPSISVEIGDVLSSQGREFIVNAVPYDIGGLGHWTQIYCEERRDLT